MPKLKSTPKISKPANSTAGKKAKAYGTPPHKKTSQLEKQTASKPSTDFFPIVGIGASAGGLKALEAFFQNLPQDCNIAFVVITHTDPAHASTLPEILGRKTNLTVKQVEDTMPIAQNTVYIPPSDRDVVLENDLFHLKKRPPRNEKHLPVDLFLKSLAAEVGERAGCVILSGSGSDGSSGLRAVKENAGLVLVQEPKTADHTGMPVSAIETGLADAILPPEEMAGRLIEFFQHPMVLELAAKDESKKTPDSLKKILNCLARRTGHDFSLYKDGTIRRRIARRITITRSADETEYLKLLQRDSQEAKKLLADLLISVTNFFRDPEAFSWLKRKVLPDLFAGRDEKRPLRVWAPGCATGEEVYSLAIILNEYLRENGISCELQIFGSDIDARAIAKARVGEYLPNIAADISDQLLKRFFDKIDDRYRIKSEIRDLVVFAEQDLLRDPPFSHLDLLVCRNLFIYLGAEAQNRLIPLFHHVLRKSGVLFLGGSETIGRFNQLFEFISKTHKIYRKKDTAVPPQVLFPSGSIESASQEDVVTSKQDISEKGDISLEQAVARDLLAAFSPACVAVNQEGDILYNRGNTERYLKLAQGHPEMNVVEMACEGMRFALRSALRKIKDSKDPIREESLRVKTDDGYRWVDLVVQKLGTPQFSNMVLIAFEPVPPPVQKSAQPAAGGKKEAQADKIRKLEQELMQIEKEYRTAREELQSSNEELKSSNEELQSSNEELQSTNEELESSKEELHSLNEELHSVNENLQEKIKELDESYRAVTNTLGGTRIAVVFLDRELRVARFTREAAGLINLVDSDKGRPLAHISDNLDFDNLSGTAAAVLRDLTPFEDEVRTGDGHWYRLNIMIHRNSDQVIEGVVLTFVNIDKQKATQFEIDQMRSEEIRKSRRFAENILATIRESLLVLDEKMRVITANSQFHEKFLTDAGQVEGTSIFELGNGQWDIPELRRLLRQTTEQQKAFNDFLVEHEFPIIGFKKMLLNARQLKEDYPDGIKILLAIEDVTGRECQ